MDRPSHRADPPTMNLTSVHLAKTILTSSQESSPNRLASPRWIFNLNPKTIHTSSAISVHDV